MHLAQGMSQAEHFWWGSCWCEKIIKVMKKNCRLGIRIVLHEFIKYVKTIPSSSLDIFTDDCMQSYLAPRKILLQDGTLFKDSRQLTVNYALLQMAERKDQRLAQQMMRQSKHTPVDLNPQPA